MPQLTEVAESPRFRRIAQVLGPALLLATPPNAIVFGSGMITVRQMARAGVLLDEVAGLLIAGMVALMAPLVLG